MTMLQQQDYIQAPNIVITISVNVQQLCWLLVLQQEIQVEILV